MQKLKYTLNNITDKIDNAKTLLKYAIKKYKKIAVGCSFGKDSIVTVHLAREIDPKIPIFSIMTIYKPKETLQYLVDMDKKMGLGVKVYMVTNKLPTILKKNGIDIHLLSPMEFSKKNKYLKEKTNREIYQVSPDECCGLLKVEPTKEAVRNLDAWISGLRKTGSTISSVVSFNENCLIFIYIVWKLNVKKFKTFE